MNDTYVTVTGNLVTKPERRRLDSNGATVVNFRIGSTARRFDKRTGGWVDGNTFFVKVSCWRSLADNAYQSLFKGDPVVVTGRLYTREYEAEDGTRRVSYELEATALGHNLARGTATFSRVRPQPVSVSDADVDELTEQPDHEDDVATDSGYARRPAVAAGAASEQVGGVVGDHAGAPDPGVTPESAGDAEREYPSVRFEAASAAG
ncbi:MAG: single-stranded DNA-binding protein [Micromonosporaceae bacterium]